MKFLVTGNLLNPRAPAVIILILIFVGAFLRFYGLNFQSLWFDELHSIVPTDPANTLLSVIEYSKKDQPPAFFIYLYSVFQLFGYNEWVGRAASALLGVLAIPVMYFLGREVRSNSVGIFAALLTSFNYMHIYYSQELRFYSMAFLLTALSFLFLIKAFKSEKLIYFIFYVVFTTALLYTHYYGLVIYAAQVLIFFFLLLYKRDKKFILSALVSGIAVGVFFLPWMPVIQSDLAITSFWIRKPEPTFLAGYFYDYFGKDVIVTAVFIVLLFYYARYRLRNSSQDSSSKAVEAIVLGWLAFSYVIPYVKSVIGPPMLYIRYTIVSLPAWLLILSLGWDEIRALKWRNGITLIVCLSMVINLIFMRKHYTRIEKQQFREVSNLVKQRNTDSTPVFSVYPWHYNYYFRLHPLDVNDVNATDFSHVGKFWLLQAEFFSPDEKTEIINRFQEEFEIAERHPFHKAEAVLLVRKTP